MTGRRVGMLLFAAIVIVALGLWASSHKGTPPDAGIGQPVLKTLKAQLNEVTEVRVSRGDGSKVSLKKQPTGWVVAEREYPADASKVRKLLIDLSSLETVEIKTSDPAKYAQLGVEDVKGATATGTLIEAVTPEKVEGIILGRTSGMKSGYVRPTDAKQSVLATPQVMADADPKRWLDTTLVDVPEARVKEVEVTPASGAAYKVAREKKEDTEFKVTGIPKGRELASPSVANAVAGNFAMLALNDVRKPSAVAASGKPDRLVMRTFDGLELQLEGTKEGDNHFIAVTPTSTAKESATESDTLAARSKGWQFEIPAYKYDSLFKPLEDLLAKLPEKASKK